MTLRQRPSTACGKTYRFHLGCGNVYVTVNDGEDGTPIEVFMFMGRSGNCAFAFSESVARGVSQALRWGVSVEEVAKQYEGIACSQGAWNPDIGMVHSCSDAIAKALRWHTGTLKTKGGE